MNVGGVILLVYHIRFKNKNSLVASAFENTHKVIISTQKITKFWKIIQLKCQSSYLPCNKLKKA